MPDNYLVGVDMRLGGNFETRFDQLISKIESADRLVNRMAERMGAMRDVSGQIRGHFRLLNTDMTSVVAQAGQAVTKFQSMARSSATIAANMERAAAAMATAQGGPGLGYSGGPGPAYPGGYPGGGPGVETSRRQRRPRRRPGNTLPVPYEAPPTLDLRRGPDGVYRPDNLPSPYFEMLGPGGGGGRGGRGGIEDGEFREIPPWRPPNARQVRRRPGRHHSMFQSRHVLHGLYGGGLLGYGAGHAIGRIMEPGAERSANIATAVIDGIPAADVKRMLDRARQVSAQHPAVSENEIFTDILKTRFGLGGDTNAAIASADAVAQFSSLLSRMGPRGRQAAQQMVAAIRAGELRGIMVDAQGHATPERLRQHLDTIFKTFTMSRGMVMPQDFFSGIQYAKGGIAATWDDTFFNMLGPLLGTARGRTIGQTLTSMGNVMQGNVTQRALQRMLRFGILKREDLHFNKKGAPDRILEGHHPLGYNAYRTNPMVTGAPWAQAISKYLQQHGKANPSSKDISEILAGIVENRNARQGFYTMIDPAQRQRLLRESEQLQQVMGMGDAEKLALQLDPQYRMMSLEKQLSNLTAAFTQPGMQNAIQLLGDLATAANKLSEWATKHPDAANKLTGLGVGAMAGAGAIGAFGLLGAVATMGGPAGIAAAGVVGVLAYWAHQDWEGFKKSVLQAQDASTALLGLYKFTSKGFTDLLGGSQTTLRALLRQALEPDLGKDLTDKLLGTDKLTLDTNKAVRKRLNALKGHIVAGKALAGGGGPDIQVSKYADIWHRMLVDPITGGLARGAPFVDRGVALGAGLLDQQQIEHLKGYKKSVEDTARAAEHAKGALDRLNDALGGLFWLQS